MIATCEMCGKEFYREETSQRRYCSAECRLLAHRSAAAEKKLNPPYVFTCPVCGKTFAAAYHNAKYCPACRSRKMNKNKVLYINLDIWGKDQHYQQKQQG